MINKKLTYAVSLAVGLAGLLAPVSAHAKKTSLVAVSADVVEISGTLQSVKGFSWNQLFDFEEATIPGILSLGEFERKAVPRFFPTPKLLLLRAVRLVLRWGVKSQYRL